MVLGLNVLGSDLFFNFKNMFKNKFCNNCIRNLGKEECQITEIYSNDEGRIVFTCAYLPIKINFTYKIEDDDTNTD